MQPVPVALLGFGNVARAFVDYLDRAATGEFGRDDTDDEFASHLIILGVADSTGGVLLNNQDEVRRALAVKGSGHGLDTLFPDRIHRDLFDYIRAIRSRNISTIVESLPTNLTDGEPALGLLTLALSEGINVVTVDKGPVVHNLAALRQAANFAGSRIALTGTTGVAIPAEIEDAEIVEIQGVLNGTTNYILTEMQSRVHLYEQAEVKSGASLFDDALRAARSRGIAEPDPSQDVDGWDTACKILILASSLMNAEAKLSEVSRIGVGPETESLIKIARADGRVVRLVGRARRWRGRVRVSVAPKLIKPDSPLYDVSGTSKAAVFVTKERGPVISRSLSGRDAIAQTIVADIGRVCNNTSV
jgi:homoserine dehydrogenase